MGYGMLELAKADIAEPDPGDETVVAGGHHRGQLVIEAGADAPVTGQPEIDRGQLAHPQGAQVVLDALAQLVRVVEGQHRAAVIAADRDLADDRQPVGIGVQRVADQLVDRAGAVVLSGVEVIDTGRDRGPQHAKRRGPVRRRPEGERARELHRAVPGPPDLARAQGKCRGHGCSRRWVISPGPGGLRGRVSGRDLHEFQSECLHLGKNAEQGRAVQQAGQHGVSPLPPRYQRRERGQR
jgi:hypothetical protein